MKAKIENFLFELCLAAAGFLLILCFCFGFNKYSCPAEVYRINHNIITFRTSDGEEWIWERDPYEAPYTIYEEVTLTFDSLGTDKDTSDDVIIRVKRFSN